MRGSAQGQRESTAAAPLTNSEGVVDVTTPDMNISSGSRFAPNSGTPGMVMLPGGVRVAAPASVVALSAVRAVTVTGDSGEPAATSAAVTTRVNVQTSAAPVAMPPGSGIVRAPPVAFVQAVSIGASPKTLDSRYTALPAATGAAPMTRVVV